MKLEKAIELGEDIAAGGNIRIEPDDVDAIKLLIEAGKFREQVKSWYPTLFPDLLPGETVE